MAKTEAQKSNDQLSKMEHEAIALTFNSTSMIEEAITLHRLLVEDEDKLYKEDGTPRATKAKRDAAYIREVKAFRILERMPCMTPEEAQMKLAYILEPARPNGWKNTDRLWWPAYLDEKDKGGGDLEMERRFMRSLYVNGGLPDAE
jgi:hypothetical protein